MKKYICILIFFGCTSKENFYHGYVYDAETKHPLKNVLVKENLDSNPKSTYTSANGYFKIENNTEFIADLVFIIDDFKKDTVVTVWSQHGETLRYKFLTSKSDTIYLEKQ